jgi:hypothetical protein
LIGLYSSPHRIIEYRDGNVCQPVTCCFEGTVLGGTLTVNSEATALGFFSAAEIWTMPVMENHVERIDDAFAFNGQAAVR